VIKNSQQTDNTRERLNMVEHKVRTPKKLRQLEITYAYAEYKIRREGDLDRDLDNWTNNILNLIKIQKSKK